VFKGHLNLATPHSIPVHTFPLSDGSHI